MNFNLIIEELLLEMSPMEIFKKHYGNKLHVDDFIRISKLDPQTNWSIDNPGTPKIGRYTKILINLFLSGNLKREDYPKAHEYLTYVYKHNIPLDITKIHTLNDIYDLVKRYMIQGSSSIRDIVSHLDQNEYKLLHSGEDWLIYQPLTEKAACYLGGNSQWCTTWGPLSLNQDYHSRLNHFTNYNSNGPLYIFINKNNQNDKYQFHFEIKQFMDVNDKQIDVPKFISKNVEIRDFFFPSFIRKVTEDEMNSEIDKIWMLSQNERRTVLEKYISMGLDKENKLAIAILNADRKEVKRLTPDENVEDIVFSSDNIEFDLKRISGAVSDVRNAISSYESDIYDPPSTLVNDMEDVSWSDQLEDVFKEYYEEHKNTLYGLYSILDYDTFKSKFYEDFYNNDKIQYTYSGEYAYLTSGPYEDAINAEIKKITDFISIDEYRNFYTVKVNSSKLSLYLIQKEVKIIGDVNDLLEDFIDSNNIQTEYEGIYIYDVVYPKYKNIENDVDTYFDDILETQADEENCEQYRKKLNDIVTRIFKGKHEYSNDHVFIKINDNRVNCVDGTVNITYENKDTGKKYTGYVKVDKLSSYALNYTLFESIITFKKNIL